MKFPLSQMERKLQSTEFSARRSDHWIAAKHISASKQLSPTILALTVKSDKKEWVWKLSQGTYPPMFSKTILHVLAQLELILQWIILEESTLLGQIYRQNQSVKWKRSAHLPLQQILKTRSATNCMQCYTMKWTHYCAKLKWVKRPCTKWNDWLSTNKQRSAVYTRSWES